MVLEDWLHPLADWRTIIREEAEDPSDLGEIMEYEARVEEKLRFLEGLTPPTIAMLLLDYEDAVRAAQRARS